MAVTHSMAKKLGKDGIQVNAVIPGATITEERIEAINSGHLPTQVGTIPQDAVQTQQLMRQMAERGALPQMLAQMMPMGRPGFPDDLAKAVLFLASDLASYVSGTSLLVDGAQTLR